MESKVSLNKIAYIYLVLPVIIFMLTWIRPVIGVPSAILIVLALVFAMKNAGAGFKGFPKRAVLIAFVIAFVWCFLAGQGGFWYQSDDHWARNAIFRDLVYHPWPVVFEQYDVLLNYYIGYWLVPALFGKTVFLLTHNAAGAWLVARIALLLWSTISVTICFLLLAKVVECKTRKHFIAAILFFILFSGLDIIGIYLTNGRAGLHLEWWAGKFQYSSFSTCLFWVFNQAVPAWVATLILLVDRRIENFAFCGLCIFISSPIPLIGLFPIYVVIGIQELIKAKGRWTTVVYKVFSLQNIIACLVIFPICLVYYMDNAAIKKVNTTPVIEKVVENSSSAPAPAAEKKPDNFLKKSMRYCTFFFLEAGIYLLILFRKHKKSLLFWCLVLELAIIPFFRVGHAADFAMRASIPPLVVLMTLTFKDFYDSFEKRSYIFIVYCIILAFAIMTPGKEFYRGVFEIYKNKKFANNTVLSIEKTIRPGRWNNFIAYNYSETLYYKYLAKK